MKITPTLVTHINGACGDGAGSLQKMDTCPTSHSKRKGYMLKSIPQNIRQKKEEQMWKGDGLQEQKVGMVGET